MGDSCTGSPNLPWIHSHNLGSRLKQAPLKGPSEPSPPILLHPHPPPSSSSPKTCPPDLLARRQNEQNHPAPGRQRPVSCSKSARSTRESANCHSAIPAKPAARAAATVAPERTGPPNEPPGRASESRVSGESRAQVAVGETPCLRPYFALIWVFSPLPSLPPSQEAWNLTGGRSFGRGSKESKPKARTPSEHPIHPTTWC